MVQEWHSTDQLKAGHHLAGQGDSGNPRPSEVRWGLLHMHLHKFLGGSVSTNCTHCRRFVLSILFQSSVFVFFSVNGSVLSSCTEGVINFPDGLGAL